MQEVVIREWCDPCFKEGNRNPVTFKEPITIGSITRRLDLCEVHEKEIIGTLPQVLIEFGQVVEKLPKGVGGLQPQGDDEAGPRVTCPRCGRTYKTIYNVMGHARETHKTNPYTQEEVQMLYPGKTVIPCTEPGCGTFHTEGIGLSTHLRSHSG